MCKKLSTINNTFHSSVTTTKFKSSRSVNETLYIALTPVTLLRQEVSVPSVSLDVQCCVQKLVQIRQLRLLWSSGVRAAWVTSGAGAAARPLPAAAWATPQCRLGAPHLNTLTQCLAVPSTRHSCLTLRIDSLTSLLSQLFLLISHN